MNERVYLRRRRCAAARIVSAACFTVCLILAIVIVFAGFRSKAADKGSSADTGSCKYYTSVEIQKGDTVWDLAGEYIDEHYESREEYIEEVMSINSMTDADDIISGQYIILPYYSDECR